MHMRFERNPRQPTAGDHLAGRQAEVEVGRAPVRKASMLEFVGPWFLPRYWEREEKAIAVGELH